MEKGLGRSKFKDILTHPSRVHCWRFVSDSPRTANNCPSNKGLMFTLWTQKMAQPCPAPHDLKIFSRPRSQTKTWNTKNESTISRKAKRHWYEVPAIFVHPFEFVPNFSYKPIPVRSLTRHLPDTQRRQSGCPATVERMRSCYFRKCSAKLFKILAFIRTFDIFVIGQ